MMSYIKDEIEARAATRDTLTNIALGWTVFLVLVLLAGCGRKSGFDAINKPIPPQADVLLEVEAMEEVEGCDKSGAVITTGLDLNGNGEIEVDEIVETDVVCNKFYKVKKCKKDDDHDSESSDDGSSDEEI